MKEKTFPNSVINTAYMSELRRQYNDAEYFARNDIMWLTVKLSGDVMLRVIVRNATRFTKPADMCEYITSVYLSHFSLCNAKTID
jgi:hypothetical protein